TLSPLNTFSSELGVQFGTCLEAPHVIDVDSQVWAAAIANGPGNYPLNASYRTADEYAFQDAVGSSLEEICKIVPGGCLNQEEAAKISFERVLKGYYNSIRQGRRQVSGRKIRGKKLGLKIAIWWNPKKILRRMVLLFSQFVEARYSAIPLFDLF
ncbi:UNVERIFIED_CONTAM: Fanconi anemia group J protein, partial [Sesamum radiatum]